MRVQIPSPPLPYLRNFKFHDKVKTTTENSGLLRLITQIMRRGKSGLHHLSLRERPSGFDCTAKHNLKSSVGKAATASRILSGVALQYSGSRLRQIVVTGNIWRNEVRNRTRLTTVFSTHMALQDSGLIRLAHNEDIVGSNPTRATAEVVSPFNPPGQEYSKGVDVATCRLTNGGNKVSRLELVQSRGPVRFQAGLLDL